MKLADTPIVLSIAGSDPSAGAGIQQDLKTICALGGYGATAITALTSQNTLGVQAVMDVPEDTVRTQILSVFDDLDVRSVKIGMVPNVRVAVVICDILREKKAHHVGNPMHIVYDPVMISTSGRRLMAEDAMKFITQHLFPLCTLVTPNLPEAACLWGNNLRTSEDICLAGNTLVQQFRTNFLIKGGHAEDSPVLCDRLFMTDGTNTAFSMPRIKTSNLHGTGCTLSSAIATLLAQGFTMEKAVEKAQQFVAQCIRMGKDHHIGHGNGPLKCGW